MTENAHKTVVNSRKRSRTVKNGQERSRTVRNGQERSRTVKNGQERLNGQERSGTVTVNGQGRLGTFESQRSNALERIVENVHGTFTVRSRSRFKNERNTVYTIHSLYISCIISWPKATLSQFFLFFFQFRSKLKRFQLSL